MSKKCTEEEKIIAKKEIILDIYGEKRGTLYKYGLAESSEEAEFCGELNSLQQKWGSRCKGFFDWFCDNSCFVPLFRLQRQDDEEIRAIYGQDLIGIYGFM